MSILLLPFEVVKEGDVAGNSTSAQFEKAVSDIRRQGRGVDCIAKRCEEKERGRLGKGGLIRVESSERVCHGKMLG